jgi:hypothetical protein
MTEADAQDILLGPDPRLRSWVGGLLPGSCGMAMLDQARASEYRSDAELYNIAKYSESAVERDLAARLYVAEKELQWMQHRPRYLHYPIDKHQSSPEFRNDFPDWLKADCDNSCDVVVDLQLRRRYFYGEWKAVDES